MRQGNIPSLMKIASHRDPQIFLLFDEHHFSEVEK